MTHTKRFSHILALTALLIAGFTTAAYSDSFVDEAALNFTYEKARAPETTPEAVAVEYIHGDSFVDTYAIEALKDFRYGEYDNTISTTDDVKPFTGDSFVSAENIRQLNGLNTFKL